jgi:hypothetical protein
MTVTKFFKKSALIAIALGVSCVGFFGTIKVSRNEGNNSNIVALDLSGEKAQAGWQDFAMDYAKGKVVDECLFNGGCQRIADGYMNYYNGVRKYESEMSYIQQGRKSPTRENWENSGKPCVTDNEWMRMIYNGQV